MRRLTKLVLTLAVAVVPVLAQKAGDSMQPKRGDTKVYANEVREAYEQPIASVGTSDILIITDVKRNHFKVRTSNGEEGFVQKNDLTKVSVSSGKSRSFAFEAADVIGYLDNPTPVYIIDMDDPNADPITLDRSFRDALKENVDKETMERLSR